MVAIEPSFLIVDTRQEWQHGEKISEAASVALAALSSEEQAKALKFYFLRDAKLAMASSLLKRACISRTLSIPWNDVQFTRTGDPVHGKPAHAPATGDSPVDFNVSHQAGLVMLAACAAEDARVGVDIVCVNERGRALAQVRQLGFEGFVDMHADVFSMQDLRAMKAPTGDLNIRLRRFFAFWSLKEAYVKLVGEGLLADWLKDVEFRNVRVPFPADGARDGSHIWGETIRGIEVWIREEKVPHVELVLQAFENEYMIGTAIERLRPDAMARDPCYDIVRAESLLP